jgi:hypothetical protein
MCKLAAIACMCWCDDVHACVYTRTWVHRCACVFIKLAAVACSCSADAAAAPHTLVTTHYHTTGPLTPASPYLGNKGCTPPVDGVYTPPPREVMSTVVGCTKQATGLPGCSYRNPAIEVCVYSVHWHACRHCYCKQCSEVMLLYEIVCTHLCICILLH